MNFQGLRSLGDIFSKAFGAYKANIKLIIFISLIINVPIQIAIALIPSTAFSFDVTGTSSEMMASMVESMKANVEYTAIVLILQYFLAPLATMAVAFTCKKHILGEQNDLVSSINKSFSRFSALFLTVIIYVALIMITSFTIVIPLYLAVIYFFYIYAVVLSDKSGYAALKYSSSIVKGRWLYVFAFSIIILIANIIVSVFVDLIVSIALAVFIPSVIGVISGIISSIAGAYFACVITVWFLKLEKTRANLESEI